ncbi:MAG: flagellar motor protein MotB [Phycisphaerae bacterium]
MHKLSTALLLAAGVTMTGCVSSSDFKKVQSENSQLRSELAATEAQAISAEAEAFAYRAQLEEFAESNQAKDEVIFTLNSRNADLHQELTGWKGRYETAVNEGKVNLPESLKAAFIKFAKANGEFVTFYPDTGLIRFSSDVTFDKGSAELNEKGRKLVASLSEILNLDATKDYEFLVAGHTDSLPVNNPWTIKKGHKDNWHLASHRAIAFGKELQTLGVSPARMAMVGYGDQRPIADNATDEGRAANRRVELVVLPTKLDETVLSFTPKPTTQPTAKGKTQPSMNKDGVAFNKDESGPFYNKDEAAPKDDTSANLDVRNFFNK